MNLRTGKFKNSRNGTPMKTRTALSVALSALMVFSTIPTGAIKAIADEVTPQVEAVNTPDATDAVDEEGVATDVVEEGESSDQQDAVAVDEQRAAVTEPESTGEAAEEEAGSEEETKTNDSKNDVEDDEANQEAEAKESDSPDVVSLVPRAVLGASRDSSDLVYQGIKNPANTTVDLFDYWITEQGANDQTNEASGFYYTGSWGNGATVVNKGINKDHALIFHGGGGAAIGGGGPGAHPSDSAADIFTGMNGSSPPSDYWGPVAQGLVTNELVGGYPVLNGQHNYQSADPFYTMSSGGSGTGHYTYRDGWYPYTEHSFTRFDTSRQNLNYNESLDYLFNPATGEIVRDDNGNMAPQSGDSRVEGKASYPDVDGLFSVDNYGYYIYNSGSQTAHYNQQTNRFELGDQPDGSNGFWPLDDLKPSDAKHNDYMGMHMQMDFSMPTNGEVLNPQGQYVPMTFTFTGDDDVWVFIDGKLVGDVGGIHQPSSLQINFKTGEVLVNRDSPFDTSYKPSSSSGTHGSNSNNPEYVAATTLGELMGLPGATFEAGTYHTIDFFYLERGNNESNLEIRFNMINTADFTAHKALISNPEELLGHDRFKFELIGLDGLYTRNSETGEITPVDGHEQDPALKPIGAETHTDPNAEAAAGDVYRYYHDEDDRWVYRVGSAADGNINFGNANFGHEGDGANIGDTYRYIIREVETPNSDYTSDERVYYMTATVSQGEDGQLHLSKRYYTDDTFTTLATDVNFASFVNLKGDVPKCTPALNASKYLKKDGSFADITEGQFAFEAVDSHGRVVATCGASNPTTHVAPVTFTLPTITPVDFNGVVGSTKTYTYIIREVVPEGATDNGDGTFTVDGVKYRLDQSTYTATFTATYDGTKITLSDVVYKDAEDAVVDGTPTFNNRVVATLTVIKKWKNAEGGQDTAPHDDDSVWVQLYKQIRTDENAEWSSDAKVGDPVQLTKDSGVVGWTHTFELADGDTGPNVRYVVREGNKDGDTFTPLTEDGFIMAADRPYVLDSVSWSGVKADENGYASIPECGSATETIENKPLQAEISLKKVDADSEGGVATIAGVTFKLYKDDGVADQYEPAVDTIQVGNDITTCSDGTASLPKLDPGTYWLVETDVPDGYLLRDPDHPIGIKFGVVEGSVKVELIPAYPDDTYGMPKIKPELSDPDDSGVYTLTVKDLRTYSLPSAGGPGVYPFLLVGAFAATFAASEAIDKRKSPTQSQSRRGRPGDF